MTKIEWKMNVEEMYIDLYDWYRDNIDGEPFVESVYLSDEGLFVEFSDKTTFNIKVSDAN